MISALAETLSASKATSTRVMRFMSVPFRNCEGTEP